MSNLPSTSSEAFKAACEVIPGGVNSPVRACKSVGIDPRFVDHAQGAHIWDIEGRDYIDFVQSWGPMILGHAAPEIVDAISAQLGKGTSYGASTLLEIEAARAVANVFPSIDEIRFVSSGTEAVMSAIRLARGFTGRDKFIKFDGNYHGHSDALLVAAGSGLLTLGLPSTPGVTKGATQDTIVVPYNNLAAVREAFDENPEEIACIIVEPVAGNMGVVLPEPGFLQGLRDLCDEFGALLIFDEVITGFRVAFGGAQTRFGITPDLTTMGKIIGGGLPVGAFGGRRDIMEQLAPNGPVYQAGTLSGNPLAMAAGIATVKRLAQPGTYEELERKGQRMATGLREAAEEAGIPVYGTQIGSMTCLFFTDEKVVDWKTASTSDTQRYAAYYRGMLDRGFWLAPSQFEACFTSVPMTDAEIDSFVTAASEVMHTL